MKVIENMNKTRIFGIIGILIFVFTIFVFFMFMPEKKDSISGFAVSNQLFLSPKLYSSLNDFLYFVERDSLSYYISSSASYDISPTLLLLHYFPFQSGGHNWFIKGRAILSVRQCI